MVPAPAGAAGDQLMNGDVAVRAGMELVADFLARCKFQAVADTVRSQCCGPTPLLHSEFVKNLRGLADAATLLAGELELALGGPGGKTAEESGLETVIDAMLRKLMAAGQSITDDKLNSSIDSVLKSDAFLKLKQSDLDCMLLSDADLLQGASGDILGIKDADVQKYWEQIQRESGGVSAEQAAAQDTDGTAAATSDAITPAVAAAPVPARPSSHYVMKPPRGSRQEPAEGKEPDEHDEYHDDDDPGYRIREIYEAELLAELAAKMSKPAAGGEQAAASEGIAAKAGDGTPAEDGDKRPSSPKFGDDVAAGSPQNTDGSASQKTAAAAANGTATEEELLRQREEEAKEAKAARKKKVVKYAASGDSFYPVELDGTIYDSFGLRVVFERDKTGFEESKEFPIRINSVVAARYQILEYLGSAAFSRAVQCLDLEHNKMVCMKIIKNDKDFLDQSIDEIKLLKYINVNGDVDNHCVLRLYDYFYHKEHLIIVTELLRDNLYEFSKFNRECGDEPYFTLGRLQQIAKQVLTALDYVHSLRLIHCDLKPENILIKSYSRCEVKVIDFGSSCFEDDHLSSYVQSRSYRAPEVMLGLPYDQKIDIWSLGCILAELWTGYVLFQNDSVQSLLARILGIVGEFPYHLMTRGRYVPQYFTQDGQLYQEVDGPACQERGRRLHLLVPKKTSLRQRMRTDCEEFLEFLEALLQLDPAKRPTAAEALNFPFLTKLKFLDGLP
eukprot:TRINITY_DN486_c0_g1_i1.p1 TRINITY_DN486_c0_g1~~TRINITY_DN486_c0_g1_i1.p1  ORF type:complete len:729 (-),score=246.05 TRINITY_DN486_c0_g1_i1:350-2536(-)